MMKYRLNTSRSRASRTKDFWTDYRDLVLKSGVQEKTATWYVNWIRQFILFVKGKQLGNCTYKEVQNFLQYISLKSNIEQWQVEQAKSALLILYRDIFRFSWASKITDFNPETTFSENKPTGLPHRVFRDSTPPKEILSLYKDLFERLHTEIRVRHYSIRTEQSYEKWVRRFLHFHKIKAAENLSTDDIKNYLEYLATEREVAADTQKQALCALVFLYEHVLKMKKAKIKLR